MTRPLSSPLLCLHLAQTSELRTLIGAASERHPIGGRLFSAVAVFGTLGLFLMGWL